MFAYWRIDATNRTQFRTRVGPDRFTWIWRYLAICRLPYSVYPTTGVIATLVQLLTRLHGAVQLPLAAKNGLLAWIWLPASIAQPTQPG